MDEETEPVLELNKQQYRANLAIGLVMLGASFLLGRVTKKNKS